MRLSVWKARGPHLQTLRRVKRFFAWAQFTRAAPKLQLAKHTTNITLSPMSSAYDQLLDATITHLENLKSKGTRNVTVSAETLRALALPATFAASRPAAVSVAVLAVRGADSRVEERIHSSRIAGGKERFGVVRMKGRQAFSPQWVAIRGKLAGTRLRSQYFDWSPLPTRMHGLPRMVQMNLATSTPLTKMVLRT